MGTNFSMNIFSSNTADHIVTIATTDYVQIAEWKLWMSKSSRLSKLNTTEEKQCVTMHSCFNTLLVNSQVALVGEVTLPILIFFDRVLSSVTLVLCLLRLSNFFHKTAYSEHQSHSDANLSRACHRLHILSRFPHAACFPALWIVLNSDGL